jgi:hypothetical protein
MTTELISSLFTLLAIGILGLLVRHYFSAYLGEKGKNLATREDIDAITHKVEAIRAEHAGSVERLKSDLVLLGRKRDILLDEKIRVFKDIQKRLVTMKRYFQACLGEYCYGSEFVPTLESLPESVERSAMAHLHALYNLLDENSIFLSATARDVLHNFAAQLSLVCSMELHRESIGETEGDCSLYERMLEATDGCLEALYQDLQFPELHHHT